MQASSSLKLYVLGAPRLERNGKPVEVGLRRGLALLVYLARSGRPQRREALAGLLWPDADEREGRGRLRRTLHRLMEALGGEVVQSEGETLRVPEAGLWLDAAEFEALAGAWQPGSGAVPGPEQVERLSAAAGLYGGDFLAGFGLPDSPGWEEWQFLERENLRQRCGQVLQGLVAGWREQGEWEAALGAARRWLGLDGLHEPAHRAVMELCALAGQPAAGLRQYQECVRLLEAELGVEPEAETTRLYEMIRARRLGPPAGTGREVGPGKPARPVDAEQPQTPGRLPTAQAPTSLRAVGREAELAQLGQALERVLSGRRQVIFVTGEAGLGKTLLTETFVAEAQAKNTLWVARGQCLEHRSAGEPYMPVLEALGRLGRGPEGAELVRLLAQLAPTWLVQLPGLISPAAFEALQPRVIGATRERMLREMVEMLEALTAERPLVLVLEDLHWVDYSTLDLLEGLARRQEPARLLVIGTYRPADAKTQEHPLHGMAQELRLRGYCRELPLGFLDEAAVEAYLGARFPSTTLPSGLARLIHQRSEGTPLFMVNLIDSWLDRGQLAMEQGQLVVRAGLNDLAKEVPQSLRELIEQQAERLSSEDQDLLEVASVAGMEFSAAVVAAGLGLAEEVVEARCTALARRSQFLEERGVAEWQDGTVAAQFGFVHQLYQHVLYERVPAGRRIRLHRQIGARLESGYGQQAGQQAAELASHFMQGRDARRAVPYLQHAAQQAVQRSAHREAIDYLKTGLELLRNWPEGPERARQELGLQAMLAPAFIATRGWGSPEAEQALLRAYELCGQLDSPPQRFQVQFGLAAMHEWRGEYESSSELVERLLNSPDVQQNDYLLESYDLLACSLFHQGIFERALEQVECGLRFYDPAQQYALIASFGEDPGVGSYGWAALSLWFLGYADQALERAHTGLELAKNHLYSLATAQCQVAMIHQLRGDLRLTRQWAEAAVTLATQQGFPYRVAVGTLLRGWVLALEGQHREGLAQIREGLTLCQSVGAMLDYPYFLALMAEACRHAGRVEDGLIALKEAQTMAQGSRVFFYEADLYRLQGDLLLQAGAQNGVEEAETCYRQALDVARRQKARALELRAAMSLARLWMQLGEAAEAGAILGAVYSQLTEGFDTADLRAAEGLLNQLGLRQEHRLTQPTG